jgi:aryl-alcohol dehydrogenase-like predicted oxidoreductase
LGIGVCPWSPLAGGFLTGKYKREGESGKGEGRLETTKGSSNPAFNKFSERNWRIHEVLSDVAKRINKPPAQVALNWVITQPGVTSTIIGATKLAQLNDNLQAADITIPAELRKRLDEVSAPEAIQPYTFFGQDIQPMITGGTSIRKWAPAQVSGAATTNVAASKAQAAGEN